MKKNYCAMATVVALLGLFGPVGYGRASARAGKAFAILNDESDLAGTWDYERSDAGGQEKITLILRADHSYTKTLEANVQGSHYGGTHSGTWTARGMVVSLSGDGNWPPYTHDLSLFRKIR